MMQTELNCREAAAIGLLAIVATIATSIPLIVWAIVTALVR